MTTNDGKAHISNDPDERQGFDARKFAFETLLSLRSTDVTEFSQRANMLLLIQAALLALVAQLLGNWNQSSPIACKLLLAALTLLGTVVSWFALQMSKGLRFWVEHWERKLQEMEPQVFQDCKIFRNHPSFADPKPRGYSSIKRNWLRLSGVFLGSWSVALAGAIVQLFM